LQDLLSSWDDFFANAVSGDAGNVVGFHGYDFDLKLKE
jgi:hypothetical protein